MHFNELIIKVSKHTSGKRHSLSQWHWGRRKRLMFHLLLCSPNICKARGRPGWTKAWISIWISHVGGRVLSTYACICCLRWYSKQEAGCGAEYMGLQPGILTCSSIMSAWPATPQCPAQFLLPIRASQSGEEENSKQKPGNVNYMEGHQFDYASVLKVSLKI